MLEGSGLRLARSFVFLFVLSPSRQVLLFSPCGKAVMLPKVTPRFPCQTTAAATAAAAATSAAAAVAAEVAAVAAAAVAAHASATDAAAAAAAAAVGSAVAAASTSDFILDAKFPGTLYEHSEVAGTHLFCGSVSPVCCTCSCFPASVTLCVLAGYFCSSSRYVVSILVCRYVT